MKRLIKSSLDQEKLDFLYECQNSHNFNSNQLNVIERGLTDLSIDQVSIYADSKFNHQQMDEIRWGLKYLNRDQVEFYTKENFNFLKMKLCKYSFLHNYTPDQILPLLNKDFNSTQTEQIIYGIEAELPIDQIYIYARPEFNSYKMSIIRMDFEQQRLPIEFIQFYSNFCLKYDSSILEARYMIKDLYNKKLRMMNPEQFSKLFNLNFNEDQLELIISGLQILPIDEVYKYADFNLSIDEMKEKKSQIMREYFSNLDDSNDSYDND